MKRVQKKRRARNAPSSASPPRRPGEDRIVRKLAAGAVGREPAAGVRLGIGDDAAIWVPRPGCETILTSDWFLEGTHFLRRKHPPDSVGWKCLARAVSDVAAMGGEPRCFLLNLALPESHTGAWLDGFLAGLRRAQQRLGCVLAGGDTTRARQIQIGVGVVGEIRRGAAVPRSGAKPGDVIFVSGRLGEAELGLRRLRKAKRVSPRDPLLRKHLYPEPRLKLGAWLSRTGLATAMMDISDGLSTDLARLCAASGVGARIESAHLPLASKKGWGNADVLKLALHGGDDYELLFTVAPRNLPRISRRFAGVKLTAIGRVTRERTLRLVDSQGRGRRLEAGGWDPFRTAK